MLPKTILRGYDRVTMKTIAKALGIKLPQKKGGERHSMKIPMAALKKKYGVAEKQKSTKSKGVKFGMMKGKKKDNDADDY